MGSAAAMAANPSSRRRRRVMTSSRLCLLRKHDVGGVRGRDVLGAPVAELRQIEAGQKRFARAEQRRRNRQVHLVDQARAQILPDGVDAAAEPDVATAGSLAGARKRGMDAIGDEMEGGSSIHGDRCTRMMGQHEGRHVIRRVVAPPSLPAVVRPRPTDRPEHVAPHDPGADVLEAARRELVVDAGRAAVLAEHLPERAGAEHPFMQRHAADAEGILQVLVRPGPEAVDRDREAVDAQPGFCWRAHRISAATRSPNALVPSGPPRSGVRHSGLAITASRVRSIASAARASRSSPRRSPSQASSMAAEPISAAGLAMSLPAMSGADPCCAWAIACVVPALIDSARPRLPEISEASSERMSPNMLVVTITSNRLASRTRSAAMASMMRSSYVIAG